MKLLALTLLPILCAANSTVSAEPRIVGGSLAGDGEYPSYAIPNGAGLCGSTLIWEDLLITAAHCAGAFANEIMYIGGNRIDGSDALDKVRAESECPHPDYDGFTMDNDLMIVKLRSSTVAPTVPLNTNGAEPTTGQSLKIIGFGNTREGGFTSNDLLEIQIQAVSNPACNRAYDGRINDRTMFCAFDNGKDSCQGDSGGPVHALDGTLLGIVSWGNGCARPSYPGVYARVSHSIDWIQDTICALSDNPPAGCAATEAVCGATSSDNFFSIFGDWDNWFGFGGNDDDSTDDFFNDDSIDDDFSGPGFFNWFSFGGSDDDNTDDDDGIGFWDWFGFGGSDDDDYLDDFFTTDDGIEPGDGDTGGVDNGSAIVDGDSGTDTTLTDDGNVDGDGSTDDFFSFADLWSLFFGDGDNDSDEIIITDDSTDDDGNTDSFWSSFWDWLPW